MKPPVLMLTAAAALTLLLTLIMSLMGGREPGSGQPPVRPQTAMAQAAAPVKSGPWAASAPGRVEPKGGDIRLTVLAAGRITEIPVQVNDIVQAGDLLLRLDDDDARARLVAADAEAAVRRRERDVEGVAVQPEHAGVQLRHAPRSGRRWHSGADMPGNDQNRGDVWSMCAKVYEKRLGETPDGELRRRVGGVRCPRAQTGPHPAHRGRIDDDSLIGRNQHR